jgi:hypothetical protein
MKCSYKNCNNIFEGPYGKLYCSRRCKLNACLARKRTAPIVQSACPVCSKQFNHKLNSRYCSKECFKASRQIVTLKNSHTIRNLYMQWLRAYKMKCVCVVCGVSGSPHPEILDFHHTGIKRFNLASAVASNLFKKGLGEQDILNEIKECVILCANCHRIHHATSKHIIRYPVDSSVPLTTL